MTLVQVMPSGDGWKVTEDGEEIDTFPTQDVAAEAGRAHSRALSAEFQLRGRDGQIQEKDSYGPDTRTVAR
jgi:hypothetical protein